MQLTLLGYILVPIFTYNQWWLVLLYACFMLYVGCLEASQRPAYSYTVNTPSSHNLCHMSLCCSTLPTRINVYSQSRSGIQVYSPPPTPSYTLHLHSSHPAQQALSVDISRDDCRGC